MSGRPRYMLVTSVGRVGMESFMVGMLVCLQCQNDYVPGVRKV